MLDTIEEQEGLWKVEANVKVAFDVMDENGLNKCTYRDLVMWIRRNYPHLHHLPVLLHAFEETAAEIMTPDSYVSKEQFSTLLHAILHTSRVWVLFDSMIGDKNSRKDENKVLSRESFVQGMQQLCEKMDMARIEEHWSELSDRPVGSHGPFFRDFCNWLAGCTHNTQKQILSVSIVNRSGEDQHSDISAGFFTVKPHILSVQQQTGGGVLCLENINLGPHEMGAWAPFLAGMEFSEIRLSHNRIGEHSISAFIPAFAGRSLGGVGDGVSKLFLSACDLGPNAAVQLARVLSVASNLESLDLSQNKCGDAGAAAICRALSGNTTLMKLNLRQNEIGVRGGKEIGDMLANPDLRLKKMDVSWNSIRGPGASAMCKALGSNRYLEKFDASWNILGDYSALELGNSLSSNKKLLHLNLSSCGLHDVAAVSCAPCAVQSITVICSHDSEGFDCLRIATQLNHHRRQP
jgi:hypothetical protein